VIGCRYFTLDDGPAGTSADYAGFPCSPSNGIIPFSCILSPTICVGSAVGGVHIRPPKQALPRWMLITSRFSGS